MNAKQLQLTGMILQLDDINVIVMEGGPKQQKFYKNLMMKRIKWADEVAGAKKETPLTEGEEDGTGERNECVLVSFDLSRKRNRVNQRLNQTMLMTNTATRWRNSVNQRLNQTILMTKRPVKG
jgi:hypothetical protein